MVYRSLRPVQKLRPDHDNARVVLSGVLLAAVGWATLAAGLLACGSGSGEGSRPAASAPLAAPGVQEQAAVKAVSGGAVHDVTYDSAGRKVKAYLLVPDGSGPFGAVLFAHWYTGRNGAGRSEFLEEATSLLQLGVVSLLPQGEFPWNEDPSGVTHDQAAIAAQVADLKAGVDVLLQQRGVDAARVALVGHDYGAMHGALLLASDSRLKGGALMAADAHWVTWFGQYWSFLKTDAQKTEYARQMAVLDTVAVLPRVHSTLLLQFGDHDVYIPKPVAEQVAAAAPVQKTVLFYDSDHELNATAVADRRTWLRTLLGLA